MENTATAPRCGPRGRWTALNIILMIVGFALFWPLGLAMLAWIIWGEEIAARVEELKGGFRSFKERAPAFQAGPFGNAPYGSTFGSSTFGSTGNAAFDEYRARELERLAEERRKLEGMRAEFESFLAELRRVKDQEEFDRFVSTFRNRTGSSGEANA